MDKRFDEIYGKMGVGLFHRSVSFSLSCFRCCIQYEVRSMLIEQFEYNLLFRWFVGLTADESVWHPTVFTNNRDRLLEGAVAEEFFSIVMENKKLLSDEHFTGDGTDRGWAGQKNFRVKEKQDDDVLKPPPSDPGSNPTLAAQDQIPWAPFEWVGGSRSLRRRAT